MNEQGFLPVSIFKRGIGGENDALRCGGSEAGFDSRASERTFKT